MCATGHDHQPSGPGGNDAGEPAPEVDRDGLPVLRVRRGPLKTPVMGLIRLYKRYLSPVLPPSCRFYPTCAAYGYEAIGRYGILRGGGMTIWRVLRCNPFSRGGLDPVS